MLSFSLILVSDLVVTNLFKHSIHFQIWFYFTWLHLAMPLYHIIHETQHNEIYISCKNTHWVHLVLLLSYCVLSDTFTLPMHIRHVTFLLMGINSYAGKSLPPVLLMYHAYIHAYEHAYICAFAHIQVQFTHTHTCTILMLCHIWEEHNQQTIHWWGICISASSASL